MKHRLGIFMGHLLCLLLPFMALAVAQKSEETTVRMRYAKLASATEVSAYKREVTTHSRKEWANLDASKVKDSIDRRTVSFRLSNFQVGNVNDIGNRSLAEFVTLPTGEKLSISIETMEFKNNGTTVRTTGAQARWEQAQNLPKVDWNMSISAALPLLKEDNNGALFTRYVAYSVSVMLDNKRVDYKAMTLFSPSRPPLSIDKIVEGSPLLTMDKESVYPTPFFISPWSDIPFVRTWLVANQKSSCKGDGCCDVSALKCGVSTDDVKPVLTRPVVQASATHAVFANNVLPDNNTTSCADYNRLPTTWYPKDTGTYEHANPQNGSYHWDGGVVDAYCSYWDPSLLSINYCGIDLSFGITELYGEQGALTNPLKHHTVHAALKGFSGTDNGSGAPLSGTAYTAASARSCYISCDFSLTIGTGGSVSFPSGNIWAVENHFLQVCPAIHVPFDRCSINTC